MSTAPKFPGILTVTLHEAEGLSAAGQYRELFSGDSDGPNQPSSRLRYHLPYALLDYERLQVSVDSLLGTAESPQWLAQCGATCKFDISRTAELAIQLYLKDPKASKGSQDVFLGVARLNPFNGSIVSGPQWMALQGGTGKILVSLEYAHVENQMLDIDTSDYAWLGPSGVVQVKKKDTRQRYARKTIKGAQLGFLSEAAAQISHPFVASLTFAHQSTKGLELYTPFVSGGHLFSHLQGPHRFDVERARLYAAEMVCALEYLHNVNIIGWLKAGNVLLDSLGHITLCGFGLFTRHMEGGEPVTHKRPEYPAPESLVDHENTPRAADWWTLGVFLYEMLTGLPPFYDNDAEKIRLNILNQPLEFPNSLPSSATDVLHKLLNRGPRQRLGAGGAAEVKGHPFFEDIDWSKLMQRGYQPVFKPGYSASSFQHHGVDYPPERWLSLEERLKQFAGFTYNRPSGQPKTKPKPKPTNTPSPRPSQPTITKPDHPLPLPTTSPPSQPPTLPPLTPTQTLTQAITHRNHALLTTLLTQGHHHPPNLPPSSDPRPPPPHPLDNGCHIGDSQYHPHTDYTPPLVRAVQMGDVGVVRMLVVAGADVEGGYHGLGGWEDVGGEDREPVRFVCGRPVQLAMELGWGEVVRVLVGEGGARVGLGRPGWEGGGGCGKGDGNGHECVVVPRGVYLRVVGGLREVVKEMEMEMEMEKEKERARGGGRDTGPWAKKDELQV